MSKATICVGGQDAQRLEQLLQALKDSEAILGATCRPADAGYRGILAAHSPSLARVDLVILDAGGLRSQQLDRLLRRSDRSSQLLLLADRDTSQERLAEFFESGADQVLLQPLLPRTLVACVASMLRRRSIRAECDDLTVGPIRVLKDRRQVQIDGSPARLSPTAFYILEYLAAADGRLITEREILQNVIRTHHDKNTSLVRNYISQIRRALGERSHMLQSLCPRSYRLSLNASETE